MRFGKFEVSPGIVLALIIAITTIVISLVER